MMLCWVHDGRHYKKFMPVIALHRELLDDFLKQFWEYYHKLLDYCQQSTLEERLRLETAFDGLFTNITGYDELDQRIAKPKPRKTICYWCCKTPNCPYITMPQETGLKPRVSPAQ